MRTNRRVSPSHAGSVRSSKHPPAPTRVVVGISEHNGWAELVTVGVEDGAPLVLDRRRVELIEPGLERNPYEHEAPRLPLADAEQLINKVRDSIADHCRTALSELRSTHAVTAAVLQESPFKGLPDLLAEVLESRQLIFAADGMMYREALASCAAELGMAVIRYPRKSDQLAAAADVLGVKREAVDAAITKLGHRVGPPWRKEHRNAAAGALRILAECSNVRLI